MNTFYQVHNQIGQVVEQRCNSYDLALVKAKDYASRNPRNQYYVAKVVPLCVVAQEPRPIVITPIDVETT